MSKERDVLSARVSLLFLLLSIPSLISAQSPDWSGTVADIIYKNCSSCHRPGTAAPFSLLSYQDAVDHALQIENAVLTKYMPPWPADPAYRHFAYEAVLEPHEITAIVTWIGSGMAKGNAAQEPAPPVFQGTAMGTVDYTVSIPPYTLQSNNEEYRFFAIPTSFTDTVYVNKIEVVPGLPGLVHHADISYDKTGNSLALDAQDPLPGFNSATGYPTYSFYMNAWMAGGNIASYPENWGIAVPPGVAFALEIHYGPGGAGLTDSTKINLQFITDPVNVRPIKSQWTLIDSPPNLIDGPLYIPANTVKTFHQVSAPMNTDKSFISINPHMHLLGKSYKVWFKTPAGDSVPLIDIPHWNFHWQKYYMFQQVQKIPAGSKIYSEGVYDNTVNNPHNPFIPPQNVSKGPKTTDEMFMCYFIFADYKPGDENIVLDTTLLISPPVPVPSTQLEVYPNPAADNVSISGQFGSSSDLKITTRSVLGAIVSEKQMTVDAGDFYTQIDLSGFCSGVYIVDITSSSGRWTYKVIKD